MEEGLFLFICMTTESAEVSRFKMKVVFFPPNQAVVWNNPGFFQLVFLTLK